MGYGAEVGYAVGAIFDLAKGLLPVALLVLFTQRAFLFFIIMGCAWLGLVTYSALATHATVSTAIADIERTGSWKMEVRSDTKAELATVEKRLESAIPIGTPQPDRKISHFKVPEDGVSIKRDQNFLSASCLVLDFDNGSFSPEDFIRLFWRQPGDHRKRSFLICNTFSRSETQPNRFRVIIPFQRPVMSKERLPSHLRSDRGSPHAVWIHRG